MAISTLECSLPIILSHRNYLVFAFSDMVHTVVTHTPSIVSDWLKNLHHNEGRVLVGFDVEWIPNTEPNMNDRIAILQLCVGRECLVFQVNHSPAQTIPIRLVDFLSNENHTFFGTGIRENVEKRMKAYSLNVANFVEIIFLAMKISEDTLFVDPGSRTVVLRVFREATQKPKSIAKSNWNDRQLSLDQIRYACADAFGAFLVGNSLFSRRF